MANFVASVSPSAPIIAIYIHEIGGCSRCPTARRKPPRWRVFAAEIDTPWPGRNSTRWFATPIGPTPGPPPPCGMQNVLCRFKWQTSAPMKPGDGQADLRVHVRAVHVNLSAVGVDDFANLPDGVLKNAVRARIGDHQAREIGLVRLGLRAQVGHVNVAVGVARDGDDFHPGHDGTGGVRAVRGGRDQADVAMRLAARFVIRADDEQSGVFALRTGVGLERNAREPGDFGEPGFELLEKFLVSARLLHGRERMNLRELRPRHGKHLRRSVELHRAGAERNHRSGERKVARFEPLDVAEHLGLGVVAVEDGVRRNVDLRLRIAECGNLRLLARTSTA